MNLSTALIMPWRASPRSSNMFVMVITALLLITAIAIGCYVKTSAGWMFVGVVLACGNLFLWMSWLGGMLLLALHANRLRLPGVQRSTAAALVVYALLTVVLPAIIVGALGFGVATALCVLGLGAAAGALAAVVPIYTYIVLWLGGIAVNASPLVVSVPSPRDDLFIPCTLLAMAALILAAVGRWWQLLRHPDICESLWRRPIVMQLRAGTRWRWGMSTTAGKGRAAGTDLNMLIRRRPDWLQPRVNLSHAGPQHPATALRVALGGMFMPVTGLAWFGRLAALLLPPILLLAIVAQSDVDHGSLVTFWRSMFSDTGLRLLVPIATLVAILIPVGSTIYVQQYWRQRLDDLALLTLLPGIGSADRAKSNVLRATLIVPLRLQAVFLVVSLAAALATDAGIGRYLLTVMPQLAAVAYVIAVTVAAISGVPIAGTDTGSFVRRACTVVAATMAGLLVAATVILQMIGKSQITNMRLIALCACWAAACAALLWIGRHGWWALQRRPHVFLPN